MAVLLAGGSGFFAYAGVERFFTHWSWLNDLWHFYDAANLFNYGQFEFLYDPVMRMALGHGETESQEDFAYPATLALLYVPLTSVDLEVTARLIFLGISIAAALSVVVMAYFWSRDWRFALLILIAGATLFPLQESLRFSQLSPFLACLFCGSLVGLQRGHWLGSAISTGLLAFKPTFAIAPFAILLLRRDLRPIVLAAAIGATIALTIPISLVGVDGVQQYVEQLGRYRDDAFKLEGNFTAGAGWMLNWNGFIGRLFVVDPSPAVVLPLYVFTGLLALKVWLRGDVASSYLAGLLATLLIVPHVVWYDWAILIGVAPFAAYQNRSPLLLGLVVALHFSTNLDSYHIVTSTSFDGFLNTSALFALATMAYLAFAPQRVAAPAVEEASTIETVEAVEELVPEPAVEPVLVVAAPVPEPAGEPAGRG